MDDRKEIESQEQLDEIMSAPIEGAPIEVIPWARPEPVDCPVHGPESAPLSITFTAGLDTSATWEMQLRGCLKCYAKRTAELYEGVLVEVSDD